MSDVAISVVVSARDAAATIGATLDGLCDQHDAPSYEVVIVDNGSNDATADIASRHPIGARVIRRERGQGPGIARNEGARAARGALIAFTDADCVPTPRWLVEGERAAADADIVQGAVRPVPGRTIGPFDRTLWVTYEYGLYETANLFVRREWFDRVGGFVDWVDPAQHNGDGRVPDRPFGEDAWFAWSARRMGARTVFSDEALVHHEVFDGDARTFVAEQARIRYFPPLVARIPELREVFAWRRYFLNRRTASFDAAAVAVLAALLLRSPVPLVGLVPYVDQVRREVTRWRLPGGAAARYATAVAVRDAVGFVALVRGSLHARAPLL